MTRQKIMLNSTVASFFVGVLVFFSSQYVPAQAAPQTATIPYTYDASGDFNIMPGTPASAIGGVRFSNTTPPYTSSNNPASLEFVTFTLQAPVLCDGATMTGLRIHSTTISTSEAPVNGVEDDFVMLGLYDMSTQDVVFPDTIVTSGSSSVLLRGTGMNSGSTTIAGDLEGLWNIAAGDLGQYGLMLIHDSNDGSIFETDFEVLAEYDDAACPGGSTTGDGSGSPTPSTPVGVSTASTNQLANTGVSAYAVLQVVAMLVVASIILIGIRRKLELR